VTSQNGGCAMDPAILPATSALIGSLIGGVSTFAASWLTQRRQLRIQLLLQEAAKRETLYAEFIIEASKRLTEAWGKRAEGPDVLKRFPPDLNRRDSQRVKDERIFVH
jgi:hypothetical protein